MRTDMADIRATLAALEAVEREQFTAAIARLSPDLAAWVTVRLEEGFSVSAVKRALKTKMEQVRAEMAAANG